jgi:hypothetical protein
MPDHLTRIDLPMAKKIACEHLVSFKELTGFKKAKVGEYNAIYDSSGKNIAYYEFKIMSSSEKENGYIIISATEDDFPIVEFSEEGKTHYERFMEKLPGKTFKMVRFGPSYIAAESLTGKLLADIGERPSIIPSELQVHTRGEGSSFKPITKKRLRAKIDVSQIRRRQEPLSYEFLKSNYSQKKQRSPKMKRYWKAVKSPHSPCTYDYYWADGYYSHPYYKQIPKNTAPNNNDHSSGCGPTSWMNIYGWHDINWRQTILNGTQTTNNSYIENLTMDLHNKLGTFEPWWTFGADQGFTWPEDMEKGISFPKEKFQHSCSYWFRHDWWNTDEEWVFAVARDSARKKRPFVVGYYEDWHYAIGYGIAECTKHGWKEHSWIRIYPAWSTNDSQNKWIPMGTIFGIYAVYDFSLISYGAVGQEIKRYDWSSGWSTAEFYKIAGNTYLFLLKQNNGIVHIHKMNTNGTVGSSVDNRDWSSGWTQAKPFYVGNTPYLFLLKKSNGIVHIHKLNSNGKVGVEVKRYDWSKNWSTVEFYQIAGNTYLFLLKESDGSVHIHKMNSNGTVGTKTDDRNWTSGWTQAKPFYVGNTPYLFLLKKSNGIVHIHKLSSNGKVGVEIKRYDWSKNWSTVEFYQIAGNTYLFLLKESDGSVHIHKMNSNGTVGTKIDDRDWSSGWTQATPYFVGDNPYLLLLKKSNGYVHIHKFIH